MGDPDAGWLAKDLVAWAGLKHLSLVVNNDAIAQREGLLQVVRHEQGQQPQLPPEPRDLASQGRARRRVEGRKRLVQKQDAGAGGQGATDGHALLLSARDIARQALFQAL